jgi:hypothetical protein
MPGHNKTGILGPITLDPIAGSAKSGYNGFRFCNSQPYHAIPSPGSKKAGARGILDMKLGSVRIRNILLISLLVPLIFLVGFWGGWFGPLELATCTARGGQLVGDYGSGDV